MILKLQLKILTWDFTSGSDGKESACNVRDPGWIPGSERSPGEGNGNPLQYLCLENPRDGGAWWAAVYGVAESWTRLKRLSSSSSVLYVCLVTPSCLTLCDAMDWSPPGSSVGILQARILEWVATVFSRGSSQARNRTQVSCTAGRFFTIEATSCCCC